MCQNFIFKEFKVNLRDFATVLRHLVLKFTNSAQIFRVIIKPLKNTIFIQSIEILQGCIKLTIEMLIILKLFL